MAKIKNQKQALKTLEKLLSAVKKTTSNLSRGQSMPDYGGGRIACNTRADRYESEVYEHAEALQEWIEGIKAAEV